MNMKAFLLLLLCFALNTVSGASNITLAWNISCDTNVTGYVIYYGPKSVAPTHTNTILSHINDCGVSVPPSTSIHFGTYTNSIIVYGRTNSTVTISNLVSGATYCFAATSVAPSGVESIESGEICFTVPMAKVKNLQLEN